MITQSRLVLRNLAFHWRGNLTVLLGVAVGSAVLTGALLVGDSLRGSLRARAERQLNGVTAAAFLPRPVRTSLADGLPGNVAPVLMLPGSVRTVPPPGEEARALGRVTIIGVDPRFAPTAGVDWAGDKRRAVLSHRAAERLGVTTGQVQIGVEQFSDLPRSSSLAKRSADDVTAARSFAVAGVLPADDPANDFQLIPTPDAPLNVFVPLAALGEMVVTDAREDQSGPVATALFARSGTVSELDAALTAKLTAEDFGLRFRPVARKKYLSVEAEQLVIPPTTVAAITKAAAELELRAEPTVIYIADSLAGGASNELYYPVIAGLNPAAAPPLGPYLPPDVKTLGDNELILADWKGNPLAGFRPGLEFTLTYYDPDVEGEGKLKDARLTFRGYRPVGTPDDRDLTPPVKGMTGENAQLRDWDRPPMLPRQRVQQRVPDRSPRAQFWNQHRATPMAYVNLATGERLFGSRYGSVTSVRVAPAAGETPEQTAGRLKAVIRKHLDQAAGGFAFDDVRGRLLGASRGGTDFGGLFLGFSCFLIAAALMLVGLLFRLSLDRRAKEVGLLLAAGYRVRAVRRLLLAEGLLVAVLGTAIGLLVAVAYNRLLLSVLLDLWPDRSVGGFLRPHATPLSFALGFGLTLVMAFGALWLSVRGLVKVTPPALLRGETTTPQVVSTTRRRFGWVVIVVTAVAGIGLLPAGQSVANPDYRAMTFFGGGALLLVAGLTGFGVWLRRTRRADVAGRGMPALVRLGARNAARNPGRSLLTAGLLASAAFLLVAVESFRRQPGAEFADRRGGSGGFNLMAETDVPVYQSPDQKAGRADLEQRLASAYASDTDPRYTNAVTALDALNPGPDGSPNVVSFRLRTGDDASCLNLYQATRPRVLDVPESLIARGGFKFYASEATTPDEKANPWVLLKRELPNGLVPVIVENNTAVWMLKSGVGGEIGVPDETGKPVTCRIVATLADSPFQSEVLMGDAAFSRLYPAEAGYRVFLIQTKPEQEQAMSDALGLALRANGVVLTPTRDRVATYQAVIGAYLSTFQLLGGLGLLLGVLGLAVVLLRGVWERVGELALLRAVGYRPRALQVLVLAENALLLVVGIGIGVLAALASVAPHVADGAAVPWGRLGGMLGAVLAVGVVVASAATAGVLRVPVIPALRRE
jgi:ABC-type lipoprotein release transport system permease subunit